MDRFLDYFQVTVAAIVGIIIGAKALWVRLSRNINPIAIGRGKRGVLLAIDLLAVAGLIVWIVEVLSYAFHSGFRILPLFLHAGLIDARAAKISGVAIVTAGLILFAMAFVSFGDSWRVGVDAKSPGRLVTRGVFTATRNPIYVFLDLWFIGIFLINGTLIFLLFAAAALAVLHWQILQEERFLTQHYGEPYQNYCERTARYFIW